MAKAPNFLSLENRYMICREYTELWQRYFQCFCDDLGDKQITTEMETEFSNMVNILSLNHYKFSELCGDFMKDAGIILGTLEETPSLQAIRETSDASMSKLLVQWHTTFLDMNKALGKILSKMSPKQLEELQQQQDPNQGAQQPQ
jgi:hypothetical protein